MTPAEFARLPNLDTHRYELFKGRLQVSSRAPANGRILTCLKAKLNAALSDAYMVVDQSQLRVAADTILHPDLAVVPRRAYCRAQLFRSAGTMWMETIPYLSIVMEEQPLGQASLDNMASAYLGWGARALWVLNPVTRSLLHVTAHGCETCFHSVTLPKPLPARNIEIQPLFGE